MSEYSHMIMRQRLIVDIPDKSYQSIVQSKIKGILEQKLNEVLETTFSAHVPSDVVISLDQIHISVTAWQVREDLETHIIEQLQQKLPAIIQEQVKTAINDPLKSRITPLPMAKLLAVKHYLLHGYFAWWMPLHHEKAMETLYLEICHEQPQAIQAMWRELSNQPIAIQRFLHQFSPIIVQQVIQLLHPTHAKRLLDLADHFETVAPILRKISSPNGHGAQVAKHALITQVLKLSPRGRQLNEIQLIKNSLQHLAINLEIDYTVLLPRLARDLITTQQQHPLLKSIVHLYEVETIQAIPTLLPSSITFIERFEQLANNGKTPSIMQISRMVDDGLANKEDPKATATLLHSLAAHTHTDWLMRYMATPKFSRILEIVAPTFQDVFDLMKHFWHEAMPLEGKAKTRIEALTLHYFNSLSAHTPKEVSSYIQYLLNELQVDQKHTIASWIRFMNHHKEHLKKSYRIASIETLSSALNAYTPKEEAVVLSEDRILSVMPSLDRFFIDMLDQLASHPAFSPDGPLAFLLDQLYQDLLLLWQGRLSSAALEARLRNHLTKMLQYLISEPAQLQDKIQSFISWVQDKDLFSDQPNYNQGVMLFKHKLSQMALTSHPLIIPSARAKKMPFEPINLSAIKDFFTHQLLPIGYTHPTTLVAHMIRQLTYIPAFQQDLYALLQQPYIRHALVRNMLPAAKDMLLNMIVPMAIESREMYQQLILKSDVVRAAMPKDKQWCIEDIFIESATRQPIVSQQEFIQHSLLTLSLQAQLPKQEIYRRMCLVTQRHTPSTSTLAQTIQHIAPLFTSNKSLIVDHLDREFLSIYQLLQSLLAPEPLTENLYESLVDFMKQAVSQGLSEKLISQLALLLQRYFPTLSIQQQAELLHFIQQTLQTFIQKQTQTRQNHWWHFVYTGELLGENQTPTLLFHQARTTLDQLSPMPFVNDLQGPKRPITSSKKDFAMMLRTALQQAPIRKRLLDHLPTKDIENIVLLLNSDLRKNIISTIQHLTQTWEHVSVMSLSTQDHKQRWWEAALIALAYGPIHGFSQKRWIQESLVAFSDLSALPMATVLSAFTHCEVEPSPTKPTTAREVELSLVEPITSHINHLIADIEKKHVKQAKMIAKKAQPQHPVLQTLYELLASGRSIFIRHQPISTTSLTQQLSQFSQKYPAALKAFFYQYQQPQTISEQLISYFDTALIEQFVGCLDPQVVPLMQQYMDLHEQYGLSLTENQGIYLSKWREKTLAATLGYLIEKRDNAFNDQAYLKHILSVYFPDHQPRSAWLASLISYALQSEVRDHYQALIKPLQALLLIAEQPAKLPFSPTNATTWDLVSVALLPKEATPWKPKERMITKEAPQEIKIYIKNSGLILIWPFLEVLLKEQHLFKDQVFWGNIAQQNALHTLQYLVTGKINTPDWRLTLNKLLCGMDYRDVAFSGYYLEDQHCFAHHLLDEQQYARQENDAQAPPTNTSPANMVTPTQIQLLQRNTEKRLQDVLIQWPHFKQLEAYEPFQAGFGINELRSYLLQREGLLQYIQPQTEEGYWHLTVTWEAYDELITKKMPWPINTIKLPFMQESIVVSWSPNS